MKQFNINKGIKGSVTMYNNIVNSYIEEKYKDKINHSLKQYLDWYNEERPHWSLNFKAPRVYDREIS